MKFSYWPKAVASVAQPKSHIIHRKCQRGRQCSWKGLDGPPQDPSPWTGKSGICMHTTFSSQPFGVKEPTSETKYPLKLCTWVTHLLLVPALNDSTVFKWYLRPQSSLLCPFSLLFTDGLSTCDTQDHGEASFPSPSTFTGHTISPLLSAWSWHLPRLCIFYSQI